MELWAYQNYMYILQSFQSEAVRPEVVVTCSSNYQHLVKEESWKEDEHQKNSLKSSYSAMLNVTLHHSHCYEPPAKPNQNHAAHLLPQSNKECIISSQCSQPDMQHGQKPCTAC
jgi:hypothetical protein